MPQRWRPRHTIALVVIVILIGLIGVLMPADARQLGWLLTLALLLAFLLVAGQGITDRWPGALVDERNKMSLSRLQLILWTVLILAAYLNAALGNLRAGLPDALGVAIPQGLWWLMGISTTSLVASPLLKATKTGRQRDEAEWQRTLGQLAPAGGAGAGTNSQGLIVVNATPDLAQWSDMFKGEETGNAAVLDIAKVQMFFFTMILVFSYGMSLANTMRVIPITELPDIPGSMVALLGISHAGYLTSKGATHSNTV